MDFFGEVMITGVFPLELRNPLSCMVASWMTSLYGPSLIGPVRKLLYQLADSWTEDPGRSHSLSVDTEELFEGFLGMIRHETTVRGDKFCDKVRMYVHTYVVHTCMYVCMYMYSTYVCTIETQNG